MRRYQFDKEPYVVIERHEPGIGNFLLGAVVGAAAALLLAPRSGAATRSMIGERARRVRDRALDAMDEATETVGARAEEMRADVQERLGLARAAVRRRGRHLTHAFDAGRAAADEARSDLEWRLAESKAARRQEEGLPAEPFAAGEAPGGMPGGTPGAAPGDTLVDRPAIRGT